MEVITGNYGIKQKEDPVQSSVMRNPFQKKLQEQEEIVRLILPN